MIEVGTIHFTFYSFFYFIEHPLLRFFQVNCASSHLKMRVSKPLSAVASATAVYAFPGDVGHAEGRSISVRGTENSSLNVIANGTATFIGEDMKSASTLTGDAGCAACEVCATYQLL